MRTIFEAFGPAPSSFESAPMASLLMKEVLMSVPSGGDAGDDRLSSASRGVRSRPGLYGRAAANYALLLHVALGANLRGR